MKAGGVLLYNGALERQNAKDSVVFKTLMPAQKKPSVKKGKTKPKASVLQAPKGMHDVLPAEQAWWDKIRRSIDDLASFYNFNRIDTPILEPAALFERGVGDETDVVQKEMYTLRTKGGDILALRPEGTAPVARAYLEHSLGRLGQPMKLFYAGQMFRHENPQAGRFRQFTHIGFEILGGASDAIYDAQIIIIFDRLLKALRILKTSLKINSIGCRVCRPFYKRQLQNYYKRYEKELCGDCVRRLNGNVLKLLDCKKESCQPFKAQAPNFLDKICLACSHHFQGVLEYLDELKIPYSLDNQLVRGLDYYSRTVFEFFAEGAGSEFGALAGGGRYDYLFEALGGRLTPAVGGAASFERLILVMKAQEVKLPAKSQKKAFVIYIGDLAKRKSLKLIEDLRVAGLPVAEAFGKESLKSQLKVADREGYPLALILGQKEIYEESIIVRNLKTSVQETIPMRKAIEEIKKRLREK